jgi:D-amino-acid dehydrogenase
VRVAVLGAGVVGLATAYYLRRDGHDVTVVDRNDGVALETSYANGAQLAYSYVAPLAGPGVLPKIPPWLLRRDSPLRFYPSLDARQWRWLWAFVRACNRRQSELTTTPAARLVALQPRTSCARCWRRRPSSSAMRSTASWSRTRTRPVSTWRGAWSTISGRWVASNRRSRERNAWHSSRRWVRPARRWARAWWAGSSRRARRSATATRFCVGLEHRLQALDVELRLGTQVEGLPLSQGRVVRAVSAIPDRCTPTPSSSLPEPFRRCWLRPSASSFRSIP